MRMILTTLTLLYFLANVSQAPAQVVIDSFEAPGVITATHPVSTLDDLTGDGWKEVVYGSPFTKTISVRSIIGGSSYWSLTLTSNGAGKAVTTIHDINGNGFRDILAGVPSGFSVPARILSATSGTTLEEIYTACGVGIPCLRGYSISAIGDLNDDGVPEFIISTPGFESVVTPGSYAGRTKVHEGKNYNVIAGTQGPAGSAHGWRVSRAGDLNGDGYEDMLVSSFNNGAGGVRAYSPKTHKNIFSVPSSEIYGIDTLLPLKDLNGDGAPEFLADAPGPGGEKQTVIFSGLDGSPLIGLPVTAAPISDNLPTNVQEFAAGFIDSDGINIVFAKSDTFLINRQLFIPVSGVTNVRLFPLEDINGDGIGEIAVLVAFNQGADKVFLVSPVNVTLPSPGSGNPSGGGGSNPSGNDDLLSSSYLPSRPVFTRPSKKRVTAHFEEYKGASYEVRFQRIRILRQNGAIISRRRGRIRSKIEYQPDFSAKLVNRAPYAARLRVRYSVKTSDTQTKFSKWRSIGAKN